MLRILDPTIIKQKDTIEIYQNVKQKLLEKAVAGQIDAADIEVVFREGMEETKKKQLQVWYEPPFTDWLYGYIYKTIGHSFIVES